MTALLAAALAGTTRQPNASHRTDTAVDPLIEAQPQDAPERAILLAAGAAAIYRHAGRLAGPLADLPAPSPADALPVLQGPAAELVADLVAGRYPSQLGDEGSMEAGTTVGAPRFGGYQGRVHTLLPEVLALIVQAGRRLPPSLLPAVLDHKDGEVRAALLPVLGARGRWLAAQNPAWSWAVESEATDGASPQDAETTWHEGTPAQRLAVLTLLRGRDPDKARQWLAETWNAEKADIRFSLLGGLSTNLSLADEPFLESMLDEKAERVRTRAASLLASLPDSALAARMRARADALIDLHAGTLVRRRARLTVSPPEELPKDWQRDGILAQPPSGGPGSIGQRAWWLLQVTALTPLTYWTKRFATSAEALIEAAQSTEWAAALLQGWSRAALTQRATDWSYPLWRWWCHSDDARTGLTVTPSTMIGDLIGAMPAPIGERCVLERVTNAASHERQELLPALEKLPRPWSADFSAALLRAMRDRRSRDPFAMTGCLDTIARMLHPACFEQALEIRAVAIPPREAGQSLKESYAENLARVQAHNAMAEFADIIRLRQLLHQELVNKGADA